MNKRKLWALIAAPGLAVMSLLLTFLLLGQSTVRAASDGLATVTDIQSFNTDFIISETMIAANGAKAGGNLDVCGNIWITETVDSEGDVGHSTSLALEPTFPYNPHISYRDVASDNLKYALLSDTTWFSQTIDSGGNWTSLALVPDTYTPCISYHDYAGWDLMYACRDGITWTIRGVNGGQRAGFAGTPLVLEPTSPYTPHISYYNPWNPVKALFYTYLSGTVWMSGTWEYEQVEPSGSGAGGWSSLALETTYPYTPHISYGSPSGLKHAWLSGTTWVSETVATGDVGWYTSLALDSDGNPHISHIDNTNHALKYAWLSGTVWLSETVGSIFLSPYYGTGTSLELDQTDTPYISYYDDVNDDLNLAHRNGDVWIIQTVDSEGNVGPYSSLALDQRGCPHISYYDATNGNLKYAYLTYHRPFSVHLPIILKPEPTILSVKNNNTGGNLTFVVRDLTTKAEITRCYVPNNQTLPCDHNGDDSHIFPPDTYEVQAYTVCGGANPNPIAEKTYGSGPQTQEVACLR